jgi:hypothetical protein
MSADVPDYVLMIISVLLIGFMVAVTIYRHFIHPMRAAPAYVLIMDVLLIIVMAASTIYILVWNVSHSP